MLGKELPLGVIALEENAILRVVAALFLLGQRVDASGILPLEGKELVEGVGYILLTDFSRALAHLPFIPLLGVGDDLLILQIAVH